MENRESIERDKVCTCRYPLIRGVMSMKGTFYIDTRMVPVQLYEEALERHIYSPTKIVHEVCRLTGWSTPEYRIVRYTPTGMLCSVTVNGYEIRSGHTGREWITAVNMASVHFLHFLGFRMDLPELTQFYYWTHPDQRLAELRDDLDMRIRDFMDWSLSLRAAQHDKYFTYEMAYRRGESPIEVDSPSGREDSLYETSSLNDIYSCGTRKRPSPGLDSPKRLQRCMRESSSPEAGPSHVRNKLFKHMKGVTDVSRKTSKEEHIYIEVSSNSQVCTCREKIKIKEEN